MILPVLPKKGISIDLILYFICVCLMVVAIFVIMAKSQLKKSYSFQSQ